MQQVSIEDHDYERLQSLAKPFVDTPASVVKRLLDQILGATAPASAADIAGISGSYGPNSIPPLTHAKVMGGEYASRKPPRDTWDAFVVLALARVFDRYRSVDDLRRVSGANVREGRKNDDGYKYLADFDFSYQGVSAEDAVKIVFRCARHLNDSVTIEFVWRDKDGAHKPGERGALRYSPS